MTAPRRIFPEIKPFDYQTAVELALARLDSGEVETVWSDALMTSQGDVPPVVLSTLEGMNLEHRQLQVSADAATVYAAFAGLGGRRGWLYMNWVWHTRGLIDRLVGGVGMRRGRRDADCVRVGEALDFWRVEAVEPDHLMRLRAEMKVPGTRLAAIPRTPADAGEVAPLANRLLRAEGRVGTDLLVRACTRSTKSSSPA